MRIRLDVLRVVDAIASLVQRGSVRQIAHIVQEFQVSLSSCCNLQEYVSLQWLHAVAISGICQ